MAHRITRALTVVTLFAIGPGFVGTAGAVPILSDPAPTVIPTATGFILHKELNAYGAHGAADNKTDILYTGDSGTWLFDLTGIVDPGDVIAAFFRSSLVADDHYGVSVASYSLAVTANGVAGYSGAAGLPHGVPFFGMPFTNWTTRDDPVAAVLLLNSLKLANTSALSIGDWIAVDWIELHLTVPASVPEPATIALTVLGLAGWLRHRKLRDR